MADPFFSDDFAGAAGSVVGRVVPGGTWSLSEGSSPPLDIDGAGRLVATLDSTGPSMHFPSATAALTPGEPLASGFSIEAVIDLPAAVVGILSILLVLETNFGSHKGISIQFYGDGSRAKFLGLPMPDSGEEEDPEPPGFEVAGKASVLVRIESAPLTSGTYQHRGFVDGVMAFDLALNDPEPAAWTGPKEAYCSIGDYMMAADAAQVSSMSFSALEESERPPAFWTNFRRTYEIR